AQGEKNAFFHVVSSGIYVVETLTAQQPEHRRNPGIAATPDRSKKQEIPPVAEAGTAGTALRRDQTSNRRPHCGNTSSMPASRRACQAMALLLANTGLPSSCSISRV